MDKDIRVFLDPHKEKESLDSLEDITRNKKDFVFIEKLVSFFHNSKSFRQKNEIYLEIIDFTLDYYNFCRGKEIDKKSSRIYSLYKAGIRELDYYNHLSQCCNVNSLNP